MGFIGNVADRVRNWIRTDKEHVALQFAKGSTASGYPSTGQDLLQAYGYDIMSDFLKLEHNLLSKYVDYEEMAEYPILAQALQIFADDTTQNEVEKKRVVWVTSKDKTVEEIADDVLHKRLRMDDEAWSIVRTMAQYGNEFSEILVDQNGVQGLNYLAPPTIRRIEGPRGELYGFVQDYKGRFGFSPAEYQQILATRMAVRQGALNPGQGSIAGGERVTALEDWEVVHFRLQTRERRAVYGSSCLDSARWIWKRLMLLEDSAMIYRLQRAPERYAFYVDVGDLPPGEALAYMNRVRQQHRKKSFLNPQTGKLDLKHSPIDSMQDFFVPSRSGADGTRIEVLGSPSWQCLAGETQIPLLDGTSPTIKELSNRTEPFWVYSADSAGRIVPGRAHSARVSHPSAELLEVTLDDGSKVRCTGNHPFLTRDGQWVLAESLTEGQSLMPLYRRTSKKANGDYLNGYEQVYDPASDKYVYTHHRVYDSIHGKKESLWESGSIIHHANHNKQDNRPENLSGMSRKAHGKEHAEFVAYMHTPEARAKLRTTQASPEYSAKLKAAWQSDPIRQERHRVRLTARMADPAVRAEKSQILAGWNRSQDHLDRITGSRHPKWVDMDSTKLRALIKASGAKTMRELFKRKIVSQNVIEKVLRTEGLTWAEFAPTAIEGWVAKGRAASKARKPAYVSQTVRARAQRESGPTNHKVVSVVKLNVCEPVYDLTVDEHHNFAIEQGVIVHNSVEDIEYFLNHLFSAIGIPKAYLAQSEDTGRQILSSQDVRFARAILRLQREFRNGISKILRVHFAAVGIDPNRLDYDVHMTVPSAIFELAQLEVKNARADLAGRMAPFVSLHWMLTNIFHLSDDEIASIMKEKEEDAERDGNLQGTTQSLIQQKVAQAAATGQTQGQIHSQQMMQDAGMGQPPAPAAGPLPPEGQPFAPPPGSPPPGQGPAQESRTWVPRVITGPLIQIKEPRKTEYYGLERKLFEGRDIRVEKRLEEKLDKVIRNEHANSDRFREMGALLKDLAQASGRRR